MKTCAGCNTDKPAEDFYHFSNGKLFCKCKPCSRAQNAAWNKRSRGVVRTGHYRRTYGISLDDVSRMEEAQGGVCAICGEPETVRLKNGEMRPLCVDHCHSTGTVRGLLCNNCNMVIARAQESEHVLSSAIEYLKKHQKHE